MKLTNSNYQIIPSNGNTLEGIYKDIEIAARTCYKSEDKITEDSATKFVDNLIKRKHYAMLEFGTVYLTIKVDLANLDANKLRIIKLLDENPYCKINYINIGTWCDAYITTNYRVAIENPELDLMQYVSEPTEYHHKKLTVKFTTSIGIVREIIRHRVFSFANESTRYCNYNKSDDIEFIIPHWLDLPEGKFRVLGIGKYSINGVEIDHDDGNDMDFIFNCVDAEYIYNGLIEDGLSPQDAREVLPLCTKSELMMCGFMEDWVDFLNKRTSIIAATGKPHPDLCKLTDKLYEELMSKGLLQNVYNEINFS